MSVLDAITWEGIIVGVVVLLVVVIALVRIVTISDSRNRRKAEREYALVHGWNQLMDTEAWQSIKPHGIVMTVTTVSQSSETVRSLSVKMRSRTLDLGGFANAVYAMRFGDWLWTTVLERDPDADEESVVQSRARWTFTEGGEQSLVPTAQKAREVEPDITLVVEPDSTHDVIFCSKCGAQSNRNARFCMKCGNTMSVPC